MVAVVRIQAPGVVYSASPSAMASSTAVGHRVHDWLTDRRVVVVGDGVVNTCCGRTIEVFFEPASQRRRMCEICVKMAGDGLVVSRLPGSLRDEVDRLSVLVESSTVPPWLKDRLRHRMSSIHIRMRLECQQALMPFPENGLFSQPLDNG